MNKQLRYDKDVVKVGFSADGVNTNYANVPPTPQDLKNYIYTLANKCRANYEPIYVDNTKYLPVSPATTQAESVAVAPANTTCKSCDENKQRSDMMAKALLVGAGVFVLYKLIAD
jgi:hypothetical protein